MGYCYTLGGGLVSWSAKKQKVVATSSTEAEYIAASEACKEGLWLCTMMSLMGLPSKPTVSLDTHHKTKASEGVPLYCNNNGAVCRALDPQLHSCSKHFDICDHLYNNVSTRVGYQLNAYRLPQTLLTSSWYLSLSFLLHSTAYWDYAESEEEWCCFHSLFFLFFLPFLLFMPLGIDIEEEC